MSYHTILVAVAPDPDSHILLDKAIAIARPSGASISLLTLCNEPDLCCSYAGPLLAETRHLLHEETALFLEQLCHRVDYPIAHTHIGHGELIDCIVDTCRRQRVDLLICGNHCEGFVKRLLSSAGALIDRTHTDVLLVPL
ncbi:universal stress protein [Edwardsiella piscicida]|uniref:universal stress protein n=1 Tax=Edwardsiella piscicida TaxID=1263550 RepID=UPI000D5106CA|nr:universal stress protein [Edwardsiella piscicida]EKS7791812.1 universal stress protein [Edwardsiella piscicida]ELM3721789.1 universal stress protein [Edwardsiella piscicida]ELM3727607.1 universal stress protein [Edwardsiella piscicida]ELV7537190.1 universal stress protein [Edwardsiella piscicida]UCQ45682.1 universal stress protein [Edwardsiella piscicida]